MARDLSRGEIWLLEFPRPDKRRPVLVLTRSSLLETLHTVTVAAITSTLRGSPTEVHLGVEEGLKNVSCVNLANVFTVPQDRLETYVGTVGIERVREVCRALAVATGCE